MSKSSITTELLANPHPGEILLEEFLKPMELSQNALARAVGVPPRRINEIVLGKRAVTADTDLRLARYFRDVRGLFPRPAGGLRSAGASPRNQRRPQSHRPAGRPSAPPIAASVPRRCRACGGCRVARGGSLPRTPARATRAWKHEHERCSNQPAGRPRLQARCAHSVHRVLVKQHREPIHPLLKQRLQRLRRHVAPREAGASRRNDCIHRRIVSPSASTWPRICWMSS